MKKNTKSAIILAYKKIFSSIPKIDRPPKEYNFSTFLEIEALIDKELFESRLPPLETAIKICESLLTKRPFTVANCQMSFYCAFTILYFEFEIPNLTYSAVTEISNTQSNTISDSIRMWLC